ncbi:MAG: GtrA family protein [Gammaproteobacteria bacterium]|nr:MAG: GtrA family protein [Gammaproteobacteria bacterium]
MTEVSFNGHLGRLFRYGMVGASGTALHYAVLIMLVQLFGIDPVWATTAGALCGALLNYHLNYHWTFASRRPHREALSRFMLVAGSGLLLNTGLMALLVDGLGWYYLVAQVLTTALVFFWTYLANAFWSFRH